MIHTCICIVYKFRGWNVLSYLTIPGLIGDVFFASLEKTAVFTLENYVWTSGILHFLGYTCFVITVRSFKFCYLLTWTIVSYFADSWLVNLQYFQVLLLLCGRIECRGSIKTVWSDCYGFFFIHNCLRDIFSLTIQVLPACDFLYVPPPSLFFFKYYLHWFNITQIVIIHNTYLCSLQQKRDVYANLLNVPTEP